MVTTFELHFNIILKIMLQISRSKHTYLTNVSSITLMSFKKIAAYQVDLLFEKQIRNRPQNHFA